MLVEDAAAAFGALSNPDRLKVIRALVEAGPDGMSAGDIAEQIGASPSRASFHLSALAEAQFVMKSRRSRSLIYQVNFDQIGGLVRFLLEDCCKGSPQVRACCT